MTIRRLTYTLASLGSCVMLTSCVLPILTSDVVSKMRDNVGERVPDFIIPGVTTREDVLMHLGEADSSRFDESELSYSSGVHRGGVLVFLPAAGGGIGYGYERELHRTLIVEFDKAGLVKSTRIEVESCSVHSGGIGRGFGSHRSCVPVTEPAVSGDAPKAGGPDLGH